LKTFSSGGTIDTRIIARNFANKLKPGDIVTLSGDLGAGKTEFVRGVCEHFSCESLVTSPTFTLVNEYAGAETIFHFDFYRLAAADFCQFDWFLEYFDRDGISLIEWPDIVMRFLPPSTFCVNFEKKPPPHKNSRLITICNKCELLKN
jgi:tRNA threonylcarbamoyladenosine biosynthesis protein TsaE